MVSSSLRHQSIRFSQIATYIALGLWSIICILPVYWLALTSIKSAADLDQAPSYLPFIDFIPNLEAWRFILLDPGESLLPRFLNSLIISSTSAIVTLVMAVCSVYGMTRFKTSHIALSVSDPDLFRRDRLASCASCSCRSSDLYDWDRIQDY